MSKITLLGDGPRSVKYEVKKGSGKAGERGRTHGTQVEIALERGDFLGIREGWTSIAVGERAVEIRISGGDLQPERTMMLVAGQHMRVAPGDTIKAM